MNTLSTTYTTTKEHKQNNTPKPAIRRLCCRLVILIYSTLLLTTPCSTFAFVADQTAQYYSGNNSNTSSANSGNQNASNDNMTALFTALVRVIVDYMYAFNPELGAFVSGNNVLKSTHNVLKTQINSVNDSTIKSALTKYVGYTLDGLKSPSTDTNDGNKTTLESYVSTIKTKNIPDLLNAGKPQQDKLPIPEKDNKDTGLFIDYTMRALACKYRRTQCSTIRPKPSDKPDDIAKQQAICAQIQKKCSDQKINNIFDMGTNQNILLPQQLETDYTMLMMQREACRKAKSSDSDSDDAASNGQKCIINTTSPSPYGGEFPVKQKILQEILDNSQEDNSTSFDTAREYYQKGDAFYNAESLLGQLSLQDDINAASSQNNGSGQITKQDAASTFINYLRNYVKMPSMIPPEFPRPLTKEQQQNILSADNKKKADGKTPPSQRILSQQHDYRKMVRSLLAVKNAVMNPLYFLYAERLSQNSVKNANIVVQRIGPNNTPIPHQITSPLELKAYLANRRLMNNKWIADMNKASPSVVQKEMLHVLAEIRQQQFESQQLQERELAILAVIALQALKQGKGSVKSQRDVITRSINSLLKGTSKQLANATSGAIDTDTLSQEQSDNDDSGSGNTISDTGTDIADTNISDSLNSDDDSE